jgi:hypothetical protein
MNSDKKRGLNLLAPLMLMGSAWAIRKSMKKTQTVLERRRPTDAPKSKHEDLAWKIGLAVALASGEALISSMLTKSNDEQQEQD